MTTLPTKPASQANWDAYGTALDAVVRELQSSNANPVPAVLSSLVTRRRPVLLTGLTAGADNTTTLNNAFAAAQPYDTLVIPAGSWTHSATLVQPAANPNVRIEGQGRLTELVATVPRYGGWRVLANGTALVGLKHTVIGATARGNGENYDDCPFSVWSASDVVLEDLVSTGSRDAAFFLSTVQRATVSRMLGRDSFADGFHITNGTTDVTADGIDMVNVGDDGVAVVSYVQDSGICQRVFVRRINVVNGLARGVSVVGGSQVEYHDVKLRRTRAASVYVANEDNGAYTTFPTSGVRMSMIDASEGCWDPSLDQGTLMLLNQRSGTLVSDVRIAGFRASGTRRNSDGAAYAKVSSSGGGGGRFTGIVLQDVQLDKGAGTAGQLYVDSLSSATVANGSETYHTATGTGVTQNGEGYTVFGSAANQIGTAGSTAAAPDLTVTRFRTALVG